VIWPFQKTKISGRRSFKAGFKIDFFFQNIIIKSKYRDKIIFNFKRNSLWTKTEILVKFQIRFTFKCTNRVKGSKQYF
jgi:hypothetical protein